MKKIFECTVTRLGAGVEELLGLGSFVLFGEEALKRFGSEELSGICVMHDFPKPPYFNVKRGCVLRVGGTEMEVLAVGEAVNHNLKSYGHATIRLIDSGTDKTPKPGDVHVRASGPLQFEPGTVIRVYSM